MIKFLCLSLLWSTSLYAADWRFVGAEVGDESLFFIDLSRLKPNKTFQVFTTLQIQKHPTVVAEGGARTVLTDMVADCEVNLTGIESATIYDSRGQKLSSIKPRDIVFTKPVAESINERWLSYVCERKEKDLAANSTVNPLDFALQRWTKK